jgi:hypothetical protein
MPRLRPHPLLSTPLLVAALVLFSASALLAQPLSNRKAKSPKTMTWVLTQGTVVDQGKTEGKFTTGYVVEATATAKGQARVNNGKFTMRCTIEDKGDHFQLRGTWDIIKVGAAKATLRNSDSIKGTLVATLQFNPAVPDATAGVRQIKANALVGPKRRHAGKEDKAGGLFTGDENFNGTFSITRK